MGSMASPTLDLRGLGAARLGRGAPGTGAGCCRLLWGAVRVGWEAGAAAEGAVEKEECSKQARAASWRDRSPGWSQGLGLGAAEGCSASAPRQMRAISAAFAAVRSRSAGNMLRLLPTMTRGAAQTRRRWRIALEPADSIYLLYSYRKHAAR